MLLNMDKFSDDYFLSLQKNYFVNKMKNLICDKKNLTLESVNDNYNDFNLPNLVSIKIVDNSIKIHLNLRKLFGMDKICSKIKTLDLSNSGLTDNGMLRLTKNISVFKNIESINLQNTALTTYSKKYIEQIKKKKIKIKLNKPKLNQRKQKEQYKIILGGTSKSGKSTYINSYYNKLYYQTNHTVVKPEYIDIKNYPKYGNKKFIVYDTLPWDKRVYLLTRYLENADGIILAFDLSKKEDFDELSKCIEMIIDFYEFEDIPVLLIGNKADLEKEVKSEEIDNYINKYKFIKYFEVSSKNYLNVKESINFILDCIYEKDKEFPTDEKNIKK